MQVNGPEGYKLARKKSLAVSVACIAVYWPTPSFKGTLVSASAAPHCGARWKTRLFLYRSVGTIYLVKEATVPIQTFRYHISGERGDCSHTDLSVPYTRWKRRLFLYRSVGTIYLMKEVPVALKHVKTSCQQQLSKVERMPLDKSMTALSSSALQSNCR